MAWSTRSKLFFLHSNSVAQNSLISEFRASYVRSVCLFKKTDIITFLSNIPPTPAPTQFLRFSPKPHYSVLSRTSLFCKKIPFSYKPEERCGSIGILHSAKDS